MCEFVKNKYDVVVIGSGIGGLSIASLLSKDNKVLVLEKNNKFGGYCTDFRKGEFKFEVAVQSIDGLNKGNVIWEILKKAGAMEGLDVVKPKDLYRAIFPEHDIAVPQGDLNKYKELLFSFFPEERANIIKLFDIMSAIYNEMGKFYLAKALKKSPFLLKYYSRSFNFLLDEFIKDEKLKAIISQYWIYRGLPPGKLSCATFSYILYDYTTHGSYFPKDGMSDVVEKLIAAIKNNGGDVLKNKEVKGIYLGDNRINSVEIKGGARVEAKAFISNIDVFRTFNMLEGNEGKNYAKQFLEKVKNNNIALSAFKIYLGLGMDVKESGIEDYEIFMNPSYDIDAMYQACLDNDCENAPLSMTIYSNLNDSFCKKGHTVAAITMLSGYDFWNKLSKADYRKNKTKMSDAIISRCENLIPGLRKNIKISVSATPLTMERYTGNSQGSIYGWNRKNLAEEIRFMNATPISNLFLSSQWSKIGGGVAGVLVSANSVYENWLKHD